MENKAMKELFLPIRVLKILGSKANRSNHYQELFKEGLAKIKYNNQNPMYGKKTYKIIVNSHLKNKKFIYFNLKNNNKHFLIEILNFFY